jgi:pimeloyl-ACP methyl ester carboxylesterase
MSEQTWMWQGQRIRYQQVGQCGPALVLVHGFGASSDHWRKTLPELAETHRVFAIDLLGFGHSAKPTPGEPLPYTFETWATQVADFCQAVVGEPAFLAGNSIGCIVALQVAVQAPELVQGLVLLNCSLRLLHERKQASLPWYRRAPAPLIQRLLSWKPLGHIFFAQLARPQVIQRLLSQAYAHREAVTPELVNLLLGPALEPGAADVFLAFIQYSHGPLPEDLLPQVHCPVLILWGEADPWEPIALGRELANYLAVEAFVPLPRVGHCPQDEAPEQVNPYLRDWTLAKHNSSLAL